MFLLEQGEVFMAEKSCHAPMQQRLHHLRIFFSMRGSAILSSSSRPSGGTFYDSPRRGGVLSRLARLTIFGSLCVSWVLKSFAASQNAYSEAVKPLQLVGKAQSALLRRAKVINESMPHARATHTTPTHYEYRSGNATGYRASSTATVPGI